MLQNVVRCHFKNFHIYSKWASKYDTLDHFLFLWPSTFCLNDRHVWTIRYVQSVFERPSNSRPNRLPSVVRCPSTFDHTFSPMTVHFGFITTKIAYAIVKCFKNVFCLLKVNWDASTNDFDRFDIRFWLPLPS